MRAEISRLDGTGIEDSLDVVFGFVKGFGAMEAAKGEQLAGLGGFEFGFRV